MDFKKRNKENHLKELAIVFLKLGFTAFGGPAAHIAMMQQEVVAKRAWMTEQHFLDLMGATNLIPGPNSTEMAIHIGQDRAGWKGLMVAGLCFISPAVFITLFFAWLYKEYGQLPEVQPFIYGIKPAILSFADISEIILLFGAGIAAILLHFIRQRNITGSLFPFLLPFQDFVLTSRHLKLFLIFLKVGAILYGSGYVLFAFLDTELVGRGLLTRQQLLDAIAVGQFTPGPVFSSVTFIGYQIDNWSGALVATLGIFLPSFVFVALLNPIVKMMRNSTFFSSFLDAVNVASIAIIIFICYEMAKDSISD